VKGTDAMTITNIGGAAEADRQAAAALAELLMMWKHGATDTDIQLDRLPTPRTDVHVASDADPNETAVRVIEDPSYLFSRWTTHRPGAFNDWAH
jgi:hypothetical protein